MQWLDLSAPDVARQEDVLAKLLQLSFGERYPASMKALSFGKR